jgi:primary-amine oxidase
VYTQNGEAGWRAPAADSNFHRALAAQPWRTSMKPLDVVQPEGPSFSVDGRRVSWEGWDLHVGFSWREGLILNDVRLQGRPVLWRAALAEVGPRGRLGAGRAAPRAAW